MIAVGRCDRARRLAPAKSGRILRGFSSTTRHTAETSMFRPHKFASAAERCFYHRRQSTQTVGEIYELAFGNFRGEGGWEPPPPYGSKNTWPWSASTNNIETGFGRADSSKNLNVWVKISMNTLTSPTPKTSTSIVFIIAHDRISTGKPCVKLALACEPYITRCRKYLYPVPTLLMR